MNFCSNPTDLKITDMRFVDIDGAPKRCTILRIDINQGISGFGEVRDASSKTYALMLKSRILGENPCNVDKIFRKIKQFGGPSRQGGGVSGIEIALWDLAGKAYGVPVYQLLGGKFRDEVRVYCDTDVDGKHTGHDMGLALKKRMEMGFTFLKMDLGIGLLLDEPGTINAPLGFIDDMKKYAGHILNVQGGSVTADMVRHQKSYQIVTTAHPHTGIHLTEKVWIFWQTMLRKSGMSSAMRFLWPSTISVMCAWRTASVLHGALSLITSPGSKIWCPGCTPISMCGCEILPASPYVPARTFT